MYAELDYRPTPIFAGSTPVYEFQLRDHRGAQVPLSALATATLTYYDVGTLAVINSRNHQTILNTNNVSITAEGLVTWDLQPADTTRGAAVTGLTMTEAAFEFTYDDSGTTRHALHKARFFITDAALVAAAP